MGSAREVWVQACSGQQNTRVQHVGPGQHSSAASLEQSTTSNTLQAFHSAALLPPLSPTPRLPPPTSLLSTGAEIIGMLTPSYLPHNKSNPLPINATGAEIVRMLETSLGRPAFLAGLRSFLERHRGGSATCEDLLAAMAGAAGDSPEAAAAARLMLRWYDQAGTPEVEAAGEWNPNARTFTLRLSQRTEPTPGEPRKQPVPIPVAVALLGRGSGRQLPLRLASGTLAPVSLPAAAAAPASLVLLLTAPKQTWVFSGVEEEPVLSLLRGCSAPVSGGS